jgi:hypothetical protein
MKMCFVEGERQRKRRSIVKLTVEQKSEKARVEVGMQRAIKLTA